MAAELVVLLDGDSLDAHHKNRVVACVVGKVLSHKG